MKKIRVLILCLISLIGTSSFGVENNFELCSIGGLAIKISGYQPTTDFKDVLHSTPCKKINDRDFLRIFKIISSSSIKKNEGYTRYNVLIKAGSFNIYMNDSYIVELNNIFYEVVNRDDRVLLCNIVDRIHSVNLDAKTVEKFCALTK